MTDNSDKIRSIVLAALMVFSVFAGTVAFAGTAAAVDSVSHESDGLSDTAAPGSSDTGDITVNVTNVSNSGQTVTTDINVTNGEFTSINNVQVTADSGSASVSSSGVVTNNGNLSVGFTADTANTNVTVTFEGATVEYADTSGTAQFSAYVSDSGDGSTASANLFTTSVTTTGNADVRKATHYSSEADSDNIVEIAFDEGVSVSNSDFEIQDEDGNTISFSNAQYTGDGRVTLETSGSDLHSDIENVTIDSSLVDGSDNVTVDVTFAPTTVTDGSDTDGYVGSNIAFETAGNTSTTIDFDGPSYSPTRGTGTGSYVYVVDTDDFDEGTYNATFQDTGMTGQIELTSLGLGVTADDVTTDDAVTATIEADDINRDVDVELLNSNDEVVDDTTVTIDSDGEATADFGTQEAGNYSIVATDVATEVEANDSLTVSEADDSTATFTQNTFSVAQGGIAEITVELDAATQGTLVIGDDADDGYQANVTFTDDDEDGEVTIQFNTYNAGTASDVVSAEGDDIANLNSNDTDLGDSLLGQGGYDLAVDTGHASNGSVVTTSGDADFGSLSVGERSTDGMTLWTAPSGTDSDELLDSATEDDTIAAGDWVVHQVEASGLDGLVDGNLTAAFGEGVNVTVQQTAETTRQNRQPKSLNVTEALNDGDIALVADAENESYYIAVDSSTDAFERSSGSNTDGLSAAAGEDYTATFTIDDAKLVGEDEEDHESVNATFEVVERSASLDMTPVNLTATDNAEITGTSTLAPGSSLRVVIESTDGTSPRFYNNPTATVQDDGTWNVTVDLSEQSAGDTFEVRSSSSLFATASGNVVESTSTPTETATATATEQPETETATATATATEAPETDTEAPDTETEEPDTETTTTTTPGFGVAVALVALLAAALLAGRRE